MKICFFSDVHGNGEAYRAFLDDAVLKEPDLYVFGGDYFGYYYEVDSIITDMRNRKFKCLLGNHDNFFLELVHNKRDEEELIKKYGSTYRGIRNRISKENVSFLERLPVRFEFCVNSLRLGFFHASPQGLVDGRIYPDTNIVDPDIYQRYDYVFLGHTHHKMVRKVGGCTIVNPGSVGQQRDGMGTSYVIFDSERKEYVFYTFRYNVNKVLAEVDAMEKDWMMKEKLKEVLVRRRK